jgi:hypothetical protein
VRFDLLGPLVVVGDRGGEVRVTATRQLALLLQEQSASTG